jgi:hypothetical protein
MSSAPGHSFEFYQQVIITTPIVAPLAILPIILVVNLLCGCIHKAHTEILTKLAEKFSYGDEKKYYLHQERPSRFIFVLLVIKGILLLMFSLAVFLNESVIASEIGCLSGNWDCFAQSNGEAIRITNCSNLGEFSDNSIQCYRPAFQYSTAISEVGGIAFVMQIIISVHVALYFSTASIHDRCLRITSATFIVFLFFVVAVVAPITFAVVHTTRNETETLNFMMHNIIFAVYYSLIYFVVTTAMLYRSRCTFDDFNTDYDPENTVITVGGPPGANGGGAMGGAPTPPRASIQIAQGNKIHTINVV